MKKILFISIIILAAIIIILTGRHSPFGKRNTSFSSQPKKEITRIVLSSTDGKELTLENTNGRWLLNGNLETRRSSINFILRILKELDIKSPVSPDIFDTAIIKNNITPVRVKIYEDRRMLNDFLVYKTRSNIYGNIMKTGKRSKPFIVYVPGHDADIGSAFTLIELYWQPYTIFNLLPSEIVSFDLVKHADTAASFSIIKSDSGYILTDGEKPLQGFDTVLVKRYLTYFTYIPFESWVGEPDPSLRRTVTEASPLYDIKVKTGRAVFHLVLWEKTNPDGTIDTDRMFGRTDSVEAIFIVRYFDIDPILKKRDYFFSSHP